MFPMSRATLSVAAGTGGAGAGDGAGRSHCPRHPQPQEVTPGCGRCPRVRGCPRVPLPRWSAALHPKHPWASGASWGDTGDGHSLTGPPAAPGQALTVQLARAAALRGAWKRETPCHSPAVPRERGGQSRGGCSLCPHLPPSPSCQEPPEAKSRGPAAEGGGQGPHAWQHLPPQPGAPQNRGAAVGGLYGRAEQGQGTPRTAGGPQRCAQGPSPISTSTSRLHTSWKRLKTRQE